MVARQTLTLFVWVRILVPQPKKPLAKTNGFIFRGVAQLGRALGSGPRGREFDSRHSDHLKNGFMYYKLKGEKNNVT